MPGDAATTLSNLARTQFVDGMRAAVFVGVVIVLIAAAVVFAFLPARAHDVREEVEGPLDGLASLTWAEAEGALELDTAEEEGLSTAAWAGRCPGRRRHPAGRPPHPGVARERRDPPPALVGSAARPPTRPSSAPTLDVLAEGGFGALTMARVIQRAGVSSATLYRRWQTKEDLVAAALASLHPDIDDLEIDTGVARRRRGGLRAPPRDRRCRCAAPDIAESIAVQLRRDPGFRDAVYDKFVRPRAVGARRRPRPGPGERGELGPGPLRRGRADPRGRAAQPPGLRPLRGDHPGVRRASS